MFFYGCKSEVKKEIDLVVRGVGESPKQAHLSANDFAEQAGKFLKDNYPSEIIKPKLTMAIRFVDQKEVFHFVWSCKIVPTTPDKAQFYFDRRGTVASGKTKEEAVSNVNNEIAASRKVEDVKEKFQIAYGNYSMPDNFILNASTTSRDGQHWYIAEYLITSQKTIEPKLK